jgi:hypothetical protein
MSEKNVALTVDMRNATWRHALWIALAYALQPVLMPVLVVLSRLLHRELEFGVSHSEQGVLFYDSSDDGLAEWDGQRWQPMDSVPPNLRWMTPPRRSNR